MSLIVEQKSQRVFTFTWSIHNFSRCTSRGSECLGTLHFNFVDTEWLVSLYPKGHGSPDFLSFYLYPKDIKHLQPPVNNKFMYVLSLRKCNGFFKDSNEISVPIINQFPGPVECQNFISHNELHVPGVYLDNDVLTLRCQLWKIDDDQSESVNCFVRTKIKVAKLDHLWILNDLVDSDGIPKRNFTRTTDILHFSYEFSSIRIHLSTGDTFGDDAIYFAIDKYRNPNGYSDGPLFVFYQIHLLDSSGSIAHSISGEVFFQNSSDIRKFPFLSKEKLLACKESYLPGGELTLNCELTFSGKFEVESVKYERADELKLKAIKNVKPSLKTIPDGRELWKENMRKFYYDGNFSDLIVRTHNQEYPVHRAILCAQSEVFSGMLTHDMKEKNSGVFEIKDFEDDTVSKLLLYLYTNTIEDIDYALAGDLYCAADKYRITPLQKMCSSHLMDSMDTSNVCDILLLADKLRDRELKACARDFIVSRAYEILNSDGWKNVKKINADLIAETTEWMIINKFLK